jgi:uncharacterized protein YdbL (DUF1318 family)
MGYLGRLNGMSSENHYLHISINEGVAERSLVATKIHVSTRAVAPRTKNKLILGKLKGSFFLLSWFRIFMDLRCG